MLVWIGKGAATVGVVSGLVGLFDKGLHFPGAPVTSYWDLDGTIGWFLLILLVGWGVCLAGAYVVEDARLDLVAAVLGAVATGFYAFFPVFFATRLWDFLDGPAWLALCTGLVPLGGALAYLASGRLGRAVR